MTRTRFIGIAATLVAISATVVLACSDSTSPTSRTSYGASLPFAQGTARSFVELDATGAPTAIGIALTEGGLSGLPATSSTPSPTALMVSLPLPAEASGTGFDHAELGWNPNGHDPVQLYGKAHFDAHFYMVPQATQMAILPNDPQFAAKAANFPAADLVPTTYVPPPGVPAASAIPQMGVHWTSINSPERNGQPFTSTFIFGSWDGQFIFVEPMVTKDYLETHPNATTTIPQPARWNNPGRYPTAYTVAYDAASKEYRFILGGLTKRP